MTTPTPISWRERAACATADPELFFGADVETDDARSAREARAKQVCSPCPVRLRCALDALRGNVRWGVFGGLGEDERAAVRESENRRHRELIAS